MDSDEVVEDLLVLLDFLVVEVGLHGLRLLLEL